MKSTSPVETPPTPRPRRFKSLLLAIAGLILLIAILVIGGWYYLHSEQFNRYIAGEIKATLHEYGLRAEIGGFGLSWKPQSAQLRDLKIYNERTNQLVVTVNRIDILTEILDPFGLKLTREIVIKKVEVDGVDFHYEVDQQGRTNLDGVHNVPSKSNAITFDTSRLLASLTGSAIHYKDLSRRIEAEVRNAQMTAQPQDPKTIALRFSGGEGSVTYEGRENRLGKLDLIARISENQAEIESLGVESTVAEVKARGKIENWSEPHYSLNLDSRVKLEEATKIFAPAAAAAGLATINGRIEGVSANYSFKGGLVSGAATIKNVRLSDLQIPFSGKGKGGQVNFTSEQIRAQSAVIDNLKIGPIAVHDLKGEYGNGATTLSAPSIKVAAIERPENRFDDLSLNDVTAKIAGANYEAKAAVTLAKGNINGAQFTGASAQAALDNKALTVSEIKAALFGGTMAAEYVLSLEPGSAQKVKASFAEVDTKSAAAIFTTEDIPISGKVQGEVELSVAGADLRSLNGGIKAHFEGKSGVASDAPPITGDVDIKAADGAFHFNQMKLSTGESTLTASGPLTFDGQSDLRVSFNSTQAEQIIQIARGIEAARPFIEQYEPQLIGNFKLEGRVTGRIGSASIEADVNAETFGLRDAILGSFAGHVFVSPTEARVEKGLITTQSGGSVKFDLATPLDKNATSGKLSATIDRVSLETILAAAGSPSANQFISGDVSGEANLAGLPASASGAATVTMSDARIADTPAQLATASVKFDGKNATLERLELRTPQSHLTANGSMNLDDYSFQASGKADQISLANLAQAFDLKETRVEGIANADFQLSGKLLTDKQTDLDWENLKVALTAQGQGVKINGRDTGELKLTANTSAGGRIEARLITGVLGMKGKGNGNAAPERKPDLISATIDLRAPGRPIRIESSLANVDVATLIETFSPELSSLITGAFTGSLRIEGPSVDENGSPTFDRLRGGLTLMEVSLLVADNPVKIETPAMITLEGSQIKIPNMRVTGEGADLSFGGTLGFSEQSAMNFSLTGSVSFDRLPSLAEGVVLYGGATVDARLTGNFEEPKLNGRIDLKGFGFSTNDLPVFVSNGVGGFTLTGDQIKLEKFTADVNDGRAEIEGLVKLEKLRPKEWRYDIKANDADIVYQEITATVDGTLTLIGTPQGQTLSGKITIPQAEYIPNMDFDNMALGNGGGLGFGSFSGPAGGSSALKIPPINLNVRVDATDSLIVRNDQINTIGSAIMTLTGPLTNPDPTGMITLEGGTWRFRGQRYEIITGSLELPQSGGAAQISMLVEGELNGYRVNISLIGPLDAPDLTLRSEPQLTRDEILSLITTGSTEATTRGSQDPLLSGVGAAASLLSSGLISRPTEQLLGISRFQIDPVIRPNANPAARLTVGQQFSRDLYLSYSTNLATGQEQTALAEYTISNRFSALATYTQGGSATLQGQREGAFSIELRGRQRFSLGFKPEQTSAPGASNDSLTRIVRPKFPFAQVKVTTEIPKFKLSQSKMKELLPVMTQGFSRSLMRLGERRLKEHLQETGYFFAEVKARCEPVNCVGENLKVFYEIEPGVIYDLKDIRIEGTDLIKLKDVAGDLQSQSASSLGNAPILNNLPFIGGYARGLTSTDRLNNDEELIRRKLVDIGYRNARVKSRLAVKTDADDLVVIFDVQPGEQSEIASVDLRGNVTAERAELFKAIPIQSGEAFSYSRIRAAAQQIKQLYAQRGFLSATVEPEFVELGGDRVRLIYNIDEGARAVISEIEINGTTKTGKGWVRRYLGFKPGEVLTPAKIRQTQRDLFATNAFREVTIRATPLNTDDGSAHKVTLNLTEAKPLLFVYGLGYSTDDSARGLAEITNTNLGGSLDSLSLRMRASRREQFSQLSFTDMRPFSLRLPTTVSVFYSRSNNLRPFVRRQLVDGKEEDIQSTSYGLERFSAFIQTQRKLNEQTSMRFRYNLERARLFNLDDIPETAVTRNERLIRLGMFSVGLTRDSRDNVLNPTKGQLVSVDHSIAARIFGGTESFNKFFANYQRYKTLDRFTPLLHDTTLAFSARIGLATTSRKADCDGDGIVGDNEHCLPISERFFSGGATNLRGFKFETAGPQIILLPRPDKPGELPTLVPAGGDAVAVFNFELRYPLGSRLRLVPFYDLGNVFRRASDFGFGAMTNTVGLGVRINTPLGPIGVDYGFLIDPPAFNTRYGIYDATLRQPRGALHIRFGQTF
jgi:outer membrane protein insertion porin family